MFSSSSLLVITTVSWNIFFWTVVGTADTRMSVLSRGVCLNPNLRRGVFAKFLTSSHQSNCSSMSSKKTLGEWSFSEPRLSSLPLDAETDNYVRRNVPKVVFSVCSPTPLAKPAKLVAVSDESLALLDMDPAIAQDPEFVNFVTGNKVLPGSISMSHRYGGYQFGSWAGQLGDGRAHLLGEYINAKGERWELQLKGSGKTPYSRFGDGRAVLRSSVREFLCSEAMFHLGVPTSRAASLVVTDDPIPRDMFYDGRQKLEKAAVVLRLAPTWFRIGSLEVLSRHAELDELRKLLRFVLLENFPHLVDAAESPQEEEDWTISLFAEIVDGTARMIAHWMSVGFTHGVMNTDNFSLASITIDYGPFGFLDEYDPFFIPNHSDDSGRYDFRSQPSIGFWNLERLGQALLPVISSAKQHHMMKILQTYEESYKRHYVKLFRNKLGLKSSSSEQSQDLELISTLLDPMERTDSDFTQTFRDLSEIPLEQLRNKDEKVPETAWGLKRVSKDKGFQKFMDSYADRLESEGTSDAERMSLMQRSNPRYILRNWMAQRAIESADGGDFAEVNRLLQVLRNPFKRQEEAEGAGYAGPPPSWSKTLKVSCSS